VQARPATVGYVGFRSPLYLCGECVWLDGMVPGATVEVRVAGAVRGSATAHVGNVVVRIAPPLAPGESPEAQQSACGMPGLSTPGPVASPLPFGEGRRPLPPPRVMAPLRECQRAVLVTDAVSGARVTLDRTAGPSATTCTTTEGSWFWVAPLVLGEEVFARQAYPACGLASPRSVPVSVESARPVPPPTVVGPLCAGSTAVTLADLIPGSRVSISQDGVEVGQGEAPDSIRFDFPVPPLSGGALITARQELCTIWSADSNDVVVETLAGSLPQPVLPGPLFECASIVRVENLFLGARVYVHSTMFGAPIGEAQVTAPEMDIAVTPQLIKGDEIFALQVGCQTSAKSKVQTVLAPVDLPVPEVQPPVDDCMRSIPVIDALPGARVDAFVNNVWRGSADAVGASMRVPISGRLFRGDRVKVRQRLCATITSFGQEVVVVRPPGRWYLANVTDLSGNRTNAEILAVHAALLHTGKILYFGGDEHDMQQSIKGQTDPAFVDHTRLFDCDTFQIEKIGSPTQDVFCSSHAMLADGRVLVAGGTQSWTPGGIHGGHFEGANTAWIFDPAAKNWTQSGSMGHGRWYPTLITLGDGRVLAISGHTDASDTTLGSDGKPRHNNHSMELFSVSPAPGSWSLVGHSSDIQSVDGWGFMYPRMHVLPGGDVLCATPMADHHTRRWTPGTSTAWADVLDGPYDAVYQGWSGTSVLLPLLPQNNYAASVGMWRRYTEADRSKRGRRPGLEPDGRACPSRQSNPAEPERRSAADRRSAGLRWCRGP
jgi:hypothetical protein